jgi:hypothetical protein
MAKNTSPATSNRQRKINKNPRIPQTIAIHVLAKNSTTITTL